MSIDDRLGTSIYPHMSAKDTCSFDLADGGNNPKGSRRGTISFYEGLLRFEDRPVLFSLHKTIEDEQTFQEVSEAYNGLLSASIFFQTSKCRLLDKNSRFESYFAAKEILKKLKLKPKHVPLREGIISGTLHELFHEDAEILVPGFFLELIEDSEDHFKSSVELIPPRKKDLLRSTFRMNGYKGPLRFW